MNSELEAWSKAGKRLKALRQEAGLSLQTLSVKAGISKSMIEYYESQRRDLSVVSALAIAPILNTTASYLLFGK